MSKIEWTDETWNPTTGCKKVSQGCKNCYAERVFPRAYGKRPFTDVQLHPERLDKPLHWKKPRRIFVDSMSDLFQDDVPFDFIDQVFAVMALCPQHTFQILTKRPERMRSYLSEINNADRYGELNLAARAVSGLDYIAILPTQAHGMVPWRWPLPNVWLGVSVEDQETADERIPLLLKTPAAVRFISAEPLLGPIDVTRFVPARWVCASCGHRTNEDVGRCKGHCQDSTGKSCDAVACPSCGKFHYWCGAMASLDQVITGGESGPNARPSHPDWFRSLRDLCEAAGVPFFFKQWGEWVQCETDVLWETPGRVVYPMDETIHLSDGRPYKTVETHGTEFVRVGKKKAGRMLDGRVHEEYPA